MGAQKEAVIPETMVQAPSVSDDILRRHQAVYMHYPHLIGRDIYDRHIEECPVCSGHNDTSFYINKFDTYTWNGFSVDEKKMILDILDPVTWAKHNITINGKPFEPRVSPNGYPYQASIIRCTSKRLVVRAGRRLGKSQSIIIRILHKLFTNDNFRVVIFTPFASQIETLWKMLHNAIEDSPTLKTMHKRSVKTPFHLLELTNGSVVQAFVGGSEAVRSTAADLVYIDEASFVKQEVLDAVIALLMENPDTELILSSTPKGVVDYFIERTRDPRFVSFHFPANVYNPVWNDEMEAEVRSELTETGYIHEVLAEITSGDNRVYRDEHLQAALADYEYADRPLEPGWIFSIGVDWNAEGTGTHIVVLGYNPYLEGTRKYRVWQRVVVDQQEWTQLAAVEKIAQLNRIWLPEFIYIDRGFGFTNEELLHKIAMNAQPSSADKRLLKTLKSVYFSEKIDVYDPWLQTKVQQPVKPFMVNQTVKLFEDGFIEISRHDSKFIRQLENYVILGYTSSGAPKYGAANEKIGDHSLDALHLAVLAFVLEASELGKVKPVLDIRTVKNGLRSKPKDSERGVDFVGAVVVEPPGMQADKERERREFLEANGFIDDDVLVPRHIPGRRQRTVGLTGSNPFARRSGHRPTRSNF